MAKFNIKKQLVPELKKAGIEVTDWEKSGSGHTKVFTKHGEVESWVLVSSTPSGDLKTAVKKMTRDAKSMLKEKGAKI